MLCLCITTPVNTGGPRILSVLVHVRVIATFCPFVGLANTGEINISRNSKLVKIPKIFLFINSPPPFSKTKKK
jgi:hypothetical protein